MLLCNNSNMLLCNQVDNNKFSKVFSHVKTTSIGQWYLGPFSFDLILCERTRNKKSGEYIVDKLGALAGITLSPITFEANT